MKDEGRLHAWERAGEDGRPFVSVVIPTWNGRHLLETCLPSLAAQTYAPFELIVVDDAGKRDDTLDWLAREWPTARVVALPENLGFTGACNAGIRAARGELIVLLNNDTEAEPRWLEELVAEAERYPEAGMVASKLRLWSERDKLHSAGDFYTTSGVPGNRGVWEVDDGRYDESGWIFGPCGGAALYRRVLFERVGLLDERFGSYLEDVDLAWRGQLAGFRCRFAPHAVVYHQVSATGGGTLSSFYNGRNWLYVIVKDLPAPILRRFWPRILRAQGRVAWEALRARRGAAARARLRGQLAGMLALPKLLRWRREAQALRSAEVSDADLLALLTPD